MMSWFGVLFENIKEANLVTSMSFILIQYNNLLDAMDTLDYLLPFIHYCCVAISAFKHFQK